MMSAEEARNKVADKEQEIKEKVARKSADFINNKVLPSINKTIELGGYSCRISGNELTEQELTAIKKVLIAKGYKVTIWSEESVRYVCGGSRVTGRDRGLTITWFPPEPEPEKVGFLTKLYNKITGGN